MSEPQWHKNYPQKPGWYWCYQALPKDYGQNIFICMVDDNMHLPRNIEAYYGPIDPPEVPEMYIPARYRVKAEQ